MSRYSVRLLAVAVFAVAVVFSAPAAMALPITFKASLDGASESPANASLGAGSAKVVFDFDTHLMQVVVDFTGLTGTMTASHIHCCVLPLGIVGVATVVPSFPGFPLGVTTSNYNHTFDTTQTSSFNASFIVNNGATALAAEAALLAGMQAGTAYFNIHTTQYGGGEIRGFLRQVPEPTTIALLGLSLAGLGMAARRRKTH